FRFLELVIHEIEFGRRREVADREHRPECLFQTGDIADLGPRAEELLVAFALNLDEVRHLHHFADVAEGLADALAPRERRRLRGHKFARPCCCSPECRAGIAPAGALDLAPRSTPRDECGPCSAVPPRSGGKALNA